MAVLGAAVTGYVGWVTAQDILAHGGQANGWLLFATWVALLDGVAVPLVWMSRTDRLARTVWAGVASLGVVVSFYVCLVGVSRYADGVSGWLVAELAVGVLVAAFGWRWWRDGS